MTSDLITSSPSARNKGLTTSDFHQLVAVPPAIGWFANIDNAQTRRAYQNDIQELMAFAGIDDPHAFRQVGRGHVLA